MPLDAVPILETSVVSRWIGWLGLLAGAVAGWLGLCAPASSAIEGVAVLGFIALLSSR